VLKDIKAVKVVKAVNWAAKNPALVLENLVVPDVTVVAVVTVWEPNVVNIPVNIVAVVTVWEPNVVNIPVNIVAVVTVWEPNVVDIPVNIK
jgi:hypothetical protein